MSIKSDAAKAAIIPTLKNVMSSLPKTSRNVLYSAAFNILALGLIIGMLVGSVGATLKILS